MKIMKNEEIKSFKQRIKNQEEQLFGIDLYFQGMSVVWAGYKEILKMNKHHYENIKNRGREYINRAEQLIKVVEENTSKISLFKEFEFPPIEGNSILDQVTERAKILRESYYEMFPGRSKDKPLNESEMQLLNEEAMKRFR